MELVNRKEATDKVLHLQRKLYRWSKGGYQDFGRLYNLTYNPNFLSQAWFMLRRNSGSRTPGIDEVTLKTIEDEIGIGIWLTKIQNSLRDRSFKPDLIRRKYIPKPGKSTMRPLGIPTLEDRLVQMVLKLILEPIYEAVFKDCSLGFRPDRGPLNAIGQVKGYMNPQLQYNWVIEADIRDCFGNIDHTLLLQRMRTKVKDKRILSLTRSFLKAGVLEDGKIKYPLSGSPQGGIISPLLANIYLDQMDEVYENKYHALSCYQRSKRVKEGKPALRLIRYADDFVLLAKGYRSIAEDALCELRSIVESDLKMELAEEKTGIHQLEDGFNFLGYTFRRGPSLRTRKISTILLPAKESMTRIYRKIKEMTSSSTAFMKPNDLIKKLNYIVRGWAQYFRYGWVSRQFAKLDFYLQHRFGRWLRKKFRPHPTGKKKRRSSTGSWKWIRSRFMRRDILGRQRWWGGEDYLDLLSRSFPPIRPLFLVRDIVTIYSRDFNQTCFRKPRMTHGSVLGMESSIQRHRNW
jgi:group II intron reverse transcriptase/maturase